MVDTSITMLSQKINNDVFSFLVVAARFFGAMSIFPILSAPFFSKFLKILLSLAFALIIYPTLPTENIIHSNYLFKFFFVLKEYFTGFIIGFILSIPIWIITGASQFIDNQRGESMGSLLNPMTGMNSSSTGALLVQSFTVYFLSMNGLIFFVGILYKSFSVYPVGQFLPLIEVHMIGNYISLFSSMATWTILIAMPVVVLMFVVEVVLGLLSTFLPQMNVTVLSIPIKSTVGILILILYINSMYQFILMHFLDKIKGVYV